MEQLHGAINRWFADCHDTLVDSSYPQVVKHSNLNDFLESVKGSSYREALLGLYCAVLCCVVLCCVVEVLVFREWMSSSDRT